MINDVTLTIAGVELKGKLSTYSVRIEREVGESITTMDGTEHVTEWKRPVIEFSFIPLTDFEVSQIYNCLSAGRVEVSYTNPHFNAVASDFFRVTTPLQSVFGLKSIDGNVYYKGGTITLRQLTVL